MTAIFESTNSIIEVHQTVIDLWDDHKQIGKKSKEACGVLIGSGDHTIGRFEVHLATPPMAKDYRSRYHFKILDSGHQKLVDEQWQKFNGERFYLGYWHTHPQKYPKPSGLDQNEWRKNFHLNAKHLPSLFYPIVGTHGLGIWEVRGSKIYKMEQK